MRGIPVYGVPLPPLRRFQQAVRPFSPSEGTAPGDRSGPFGARARRIFCFACAAAAAAGLAVTFSRGSYLALIAVIGVFCLCYPRKWPLYVLGLAAVLLILPEAVTGRFLSIGTIDNSIAERLRVWQVGMDSIARHPLIGIGPGTYNTWYLLRDAGINAPHMHNLYLQLLTEGGVIGFV